MKSHSESRSFRLCAVAVLVAGLSGTVWADGGNTPVVDQAAVDKADAIATIDASRDIVISNLVSQWTPAATALGYILTEWSNEFAAMLGSASSTQLYDIGNAANYDAVRAILQGRSAAVNTDGLVGVSDLGDTASDLVFTPVTPCRIVDTRFDTDGGTKPLLDVNYNYYVHGSAALLYTQGHNSGVNAGSGCFSPGGEPAAIAGNFTVANASANGNIRAFPYLAATPAVSLLNYQANANLANAAIVATCYGCARDMSIRSAFGSTHWIADVMGYFYPVDRSDLVAASATNNTFGTIVSGDNFAMSPNVVSPAKNGKCLVQTHVEVNTQTTDTGTSAFVRTARQVNAATPAEDPIYGQYAIAVGKTSALPITVSYVWDVTAGNNYNFGCFIYGIGDFIGNSFNCRTSHMCF